VGVGVEDEVVTEIAIAVEIDGSYQLIRMI